MMIIITTNPLYPCCRQVRLYAHLHSLSQFMGIEHQLFRQRRPAPPSIKLMPRVSFKLAHPVMIKTFSPSPTLHPSSGLEEYLEPLEKSLQAHEVIAL